MTDHAHIFRPAKGDDPRTLVLFHGTGGDETSFFGLGEAIAPTAAVLSLRGDVNENGMLRFFRRTGEGIYDMEDLAIRTAAMADFVRRTLATAGRDPSAAIGVGYSNGANILANMLFTAPDVMRNAILMHPLIPFDPAPQPGLKDARILVTAGDRDPICPAALSDRLEDWLARQGAHVDRLRHAGGHELRPEEVSAAKAWAAGFGNGTAQTAA
ncbi:MAG: alpha/beta hydrolase [Pseudomonadota bacterium]